MTVCEQGEHGLGTPARRLATLGVAWAAATAIAITGCSNPTPGSPRASAPAPTAGVVATRAPSATPTPATTAPRAAPMTPVRVTVPAIGVDAPLVRLGLTSAGALAVPTKAMSAGWYTGSPVPGQVGPAIIAGHVHWSGIPAVFARLAKLTPGDRIIVTRSDGTTAAFAVDRVTTYAKTRFPTALVYGPITVPGLRLITCGGFDPVARTYDDNVVVFATLATA